VLFALALVLAASEPARPAVALLPLRPLGVPADVVAALELTLRNELSQLPEARVVPEKDVTLQLSREPGCIERMACAAAAASRAGARQLILGTASQLGDSFMIDLKLIDARSAQELRRATHPVNGSRDALIEILRESAVELLAPTRFVGGLQIEVPDAPGAAVFIDGKQVGTVPLLQPVEGRELSTFVEVRYGRTGKAKVELGPVHVQKSALPEAAVPRVQTAQRKPAWVRPAAVAGIGLALMTAAVAVVYQARASSTASDLNHRESQNLLVPGDVNNYNEVSHDTHLARDYYIAGAVLGAFGGAFLYWDLR
jgi:hypothetical protein